MALEAEEPQSTSSGRAVDAHRLSVPLGGWWRLMIVGATALALTFGVTYLIMRLFYPLALLFFGIVVAEALSPIINSLQRIIPRVAAIVLVYVALVLITAALAYVILPPVIQQIYQGTGQVPGQITHFEHYLTQSTGLSSSQLSSGLTNVLNRLADRFSSLPIRIFSGLFDVVLVYFLSIYWLFVTTPLKRFVISLFPDEKQRDVTNVLREMGHDMGGYLRGSVMSGIITGGLAFAGLSIIHVNYALALGVLTAFGELIPVVGIILVAALVVIVAMFQSFTHALLALAIYAVILFLESHLLAPNIMRSQTTVSQVMVLFALVAGFEIGGVLGALVAIPLSAGVRVLVIRVFAPGIRKWTGATACHAEEDSKHRVGATKQPRSEDAFKSQNTAAFITRVADLLDREHRFTSKETG